MLPSSLCKCCIYHSRATSLTKILLKDKATRTTIGLAFPESKTTEDLFECDFLANVTTALPYGFCGFGIQAEGNKKFSQ